MAEKTVFKEGDKVQLKSGGPIMTIQTVSQGGGIECQWFSGSKLQRGYFQAHSLMKAEEKDE